MNLSAAIRWDAAKAALAALAIAFIARSLVPVGFMLSFEDGGVRLVACSGDAAVQSAKAAPSAHHHHENGGGKTGDNDKAGAACPYAASNSLSFAHAPEIAVTANVVAAPVALRPETHKVRIAAHANRSRAPPAFS